MSLKEKFDYLTFVLGNHPTDKGTYHNYLPVYQTEFTNIKGIKLLEIGIYTGGSLKLCNEYFIDSELHGIDDVIREEGNNIPGTIHWGKYEDLTEKFKDNYFDYIINDSMHDSEAQINAFNLYYPKLSYGGKFFMEDIPDTKSLDLILKELNGHQLRVWDMRNSSDKEDSIILVVTK